MRNWRKVLSVLGLLVIGLGGLLPALLSGGVPAAQAGLAPEIQANAAGPACYLLDDPQVRQRMSAMGEEALLEACGRRPSPPLPAAPPLAPSPETGGAAAAADVRVTVVDPNAASTTQSETSISINRTTGTLCANWNDSYHYLVQGLSYIGFARSTDGGQTWQDGPANYLPQGGGGRARGDPSVAWRALDNRWYATSIHLGSSQGLGFWRSLDDCATFEWVGMAHAGSADDKELLVIDNYPLSPHYGRMYIAWTDFAAGMSVTYSDNGTAWSTPVIVSYDNVQGAWPAVAPNGDVYVAWVRWTTGDYMDMEVSRSSNGGVSFSRVTNPATNAIVPYDVGASSQCGRDALNGRIRYLPSPQIAVGPDGCLHVVYPRDPDGHGTGDVIDAYYRRSCNNGASWEVERLLNDDGTLTDQFFPNVTVNENNVVAASWYDRRLDTSGNLLFDRYWAYSPDGGTTWQPNGRVSDVSSPVYIDPNMSTCYHGDYDQIAADATSVHIIWSDDRVYFNGHQDPDIWFERVPLACDPVMGADFSWQPPDPVVGQAVEFSATAWAGAGWYSEAVGSPSASHISLAHDSAGQPHVSYIGPAGLMYAHDDGSGWITTTVDTSVAYIWEGTTSIALDANDLPHISYYDDVDSQLKYARYDGTAWHIEELNTPSHGGGWNALDVDSQGRPHIVYQGHETYLHYTWFDGTAWQNEVIDGVYNAGYFNDLVLDEQDRPHVISSVALGPFRYIWHDGASWQMQSLSVEAYYSALALDGAGRPHISVWTQNGSGDGELLYLRLDGTDWYITLLETVGGANWGKYTSIALDSFERPHVSYALAGGVLRYARRSGSTWQYETLPGTGYYPAMVLDAAGRPWMAYGSQLTYAWKSFADPTPPIEYTWDLGDGTIAAGAAVSHSYAFSGTYTVVLTAANCLTATATVVHTITVAGCDPVAGADFSWTPLTPTVQQMLAFTGTAWGSGPAEWTNELVYGDIGRHLSMRLDGAGQARISFYDANATSLRYAYWDGDSWVTEIVDDTSYDVGWGSSLALDAAGRPHISYFDFANQCLKYAYWDSAAWSLHVVDASADVGWNSSLELDAEGHPHISYYNLSTSDLKYAFWNGTHWISETVESAGSVGAYSSLELDAAGRPHIAYSGATDARYAYWDGTGWVIQVVDGAANAGIDTVLALDAAGRPHISYDAYDPHDVRYAWFDGNAWFTETVASVGDIRSTSLALDAAGRPHISFHDRTNGELVYGIRTTGWTFETVAMNVFGSGGQSSLALDAQDQPRIGYYDPSSMSVNYARRDAGQPSLPISYTWSLGDGSFAAGETMSHTYSIPGVYTVVLTATNCGGASATAVHTVTVIQPCDPVYDVGFAWTPFTPTVGQQVTFTGTATGTLPITYSWKLDVGSWKEGEVVTYTYDVPGVYAVVLTATNCATATVTVTHALTVLPPPCDPVHDVAFTWLPLTPTVGQEVAFAGTATGTLPITYSWKLDAAGWKMGPVVTYTYDLPGVYTVALTATNCATATAVVTHEITVLPLPCDPVEIVTVTRAISGCVVALGVELTGTAPFTYLWQAGPLTSTLPAPTFAFGASGTYTVTLTAGNCGGQDMATVPVQVVCPGPVWRVYLPVVFR